MAVADAMTDAGRQLGLVVDDDADMRSMLADYLIMSGFEVRQAANGLEALLHVKRERPRVILLDLHMPRLGGLDAVQRIRAFDRNTKVIVVTGDPDQQLHDRALRLGASLVLTKPLDFTALDVAIGRPPGAYADAVPGSEAPVAQIAPPAQPTARPPAPVGGMVLIVDDDPELRAVLEELMAARGHGTQVVADAIAALRVIGQEAPDVVLLDIEMPGLKGSDALPAILALAPSTKVIMVSGVPNAEVGKRALVAGAFDYVAKPIDLSYLTHSVETALSMKQAGL
jgi:DNA-binding NtrC family response regulator